MCAPAHEQSTRGSVVMKAACGHRVWVSQVGMLQVLGPIKTTIMCTSCAVERMEQEPAPLDVRAAPGAMAELEASEGREARGWAERWSKELGIETQG